MNLKSYPINPDLFNNASSDYEGGACYNLPKAFTSLRLSGVLSPLPMTHPIGTKCVSDHAPGPGSVIPKAKSLHFFEVE